MRKYNIKRAVSKLLAASMVLTMLAPAIPSYAATSGKIEFDIGEGLYNKYTGNPNPVLHDPAAAAGDPLNVPGETPVGGRFYVPFWDGSNFNGGVTPAVWNWNGGSYTFPGYKMDGWYENKTYQAQGFKTELMPGYYPYADKSYIGKLISDGTEYDWKVEYSGLHPAITPQDGDPATATTHPLERLTGKKKVLEGLVVLPKTIPGYKLKSPLEPAGLSFKFYEPGGTYATENTPLPAANRYSFIVDSRGFIKGTMTNKDVAAKINYEVDTGTKFNLNIKHILVDAAGNKISERQDPSHKFNVGENIYGIEPDPSLIVPLTGMTEARYKLVTADGANNKKAPRLRLGGGAPLDSADASHIKYLLHPDDGSIAFDSDKKITGTMINRTLEVQYVYEPNPNYVISAKVTYKDTYNNNVTDAVVAQLNGDGGNDVVTNGTDPVKWYKVGSGAAAYIEAAVPPSTGKDIPAPALSGFLQTPGSVTMGYSENGTEFSNDGGQATFGGWSDSNQKFNMTMGSTGRSVGFKVTYQVDPGATAQLSFTTNTGGRLTKNGQPWNPNTDPVILAKDTAGNVVVNTAVDLPDATPDPGYDFDAWYLPSGTTPLGATFTLGAPYSLEARFKHNAANWNQYTFAIAPSSNGLIFMPGAPVTNEAKNIDNMGNALASYTWQDAINDGVVPTATPLGAYAVKWYDSNMQEIQPTDDILGRAGETFTAYAVSTTPVAVGDPTVLAHELDASAQPLISVQIPAGEHPAMQYLIIDDITGKVVDVISSNDLQATSGMIQNKPYLSPGGKYKVAQALPGYAVNVGDPISGHTHPNISATPTQADIPEVINESIEQDTNNPGKAKVTIPVITPNTEYALVDAAGNVVSGFAQPGSAPLVYDNLDRDATYRIIARPAGSTASIADRGPGYDILTNNLPVSATHFKVTVVTPTGGEIEGIEITDEGVTTGSLSTVDMSLLDQVHKGATVKIKVATTDANGNFFDSWHKVSSFTGGSASLNTYTFVMPRKPITLQAKYSVPGVTWDTPVLPGGTPPIGAANPYITVPGKYRVKVTKGTMSAAFKTAIENDVNPDPYTDLYTLKAVLEKETPSGSGSYVEDASYAGQGIAVTVDTGALDTTRDYKLYLASASNATEVSSDLGLDFADPNYGGGFTANFEAGSLYGFGYTLPQTHTITIVNTITGMPGGVLQKQSHHPVRVSDVSPWLTPSPHIAANGVTWIYKGIATVDTSSPYAGNEYDPTQRFTADTTLYLYYEDDAVPRNAAETRLGDAIAEARQTLRLNVLQPFSRELINAFRDAKALYDRTAPTKATRAELEAMEIHLNAVIARAKANLGSGGGGGGGGGGGSTGGSGSGRSRRNVENKITGVIKVGIDGDWELVDAANHKWVFNLTNDPNHKRLKGWAALSYTYEGETRVDWYHFADNNIMDSGWFKDESSGAWYYYDNKLV